MTEYRSIQHSTEYQMGYKDGFVAGTESGYRLVAKVAANHTSPILLEIPEGSALLHDEVRMKEIERLAEIGRATEYATRKHDPAPIVIVSIEGFIGWYRKEAAE